MSVATTAVSVPMTAATDSVQIPVSLTMSVNVVPVPRNYGKITYDGSVITVS